MRKFVAEEFYPGAPTEGVRAERELRVNQFLDRVIKSLQRGATEEALTVQATDLEASFRREDTEEREKVGDYIGETMRIIGLKYGNPKDGEDPEERKKYFGFKSQ